PPTPAPITTTSAVRSHRVCAWALVAVAPVSAAAPTPAAAPFDRKDRRLRAGGVSFLSLRSCVLIVSLPCGRVCLRPILTSPAAGSRQHPDAGSISFGAGSGRPNSRLRMVGGRGLLTLIMASTVALAASGVDVRPARADHRCDPIGEPGWRTVPSHEV